MPDRRLVLRSRAVEDLESIWHYTVQEWSVQQAFRYNELLEREISFLCDNPFAQPSREEPEMGVRIKHAGRHIIAYQVFDDRIEVIRILHEASDWVTKFGL